MNDNFYGWKNRATWNVTLWILNDEDLYRTLREESDDLRRAKSEWTPALAKEFCHRWMGDQTPDEVPLGSSEIAWEEVAECMNQEVHSN